jgi:hypothetical protein
MTIAQNTKQSGFTSAESGIRLVKEGGNTLPDTSAHPVKNALAKFWAPFLGYLKLRLSSK